MARRVIDLVRTRTRIESGSSVFPDGRDRYAVLVHFSVSTRVTRSTAALVRELHRSGYFVVVSSACEAEGDLEWPEGGMPADTIVIRKPNLGYDFGTAAVALNLYPQVKRAPFVLVINDSNVGPFAGLDSVMADFETTTADVWGLTGSNQHGFHLQSFFLGFRDGVLLERPLLDFWRNVRHFRDKRKVILHYELGMSRTLQQEGYVLEAMFTHTDFEHASASNLSVHLWLDLLVRGYPFIKREIVQKPWIDESALQIPAVARYFYGEDVAAWL
jgi:lipopolysaccharide biosynthesis protein